MDFSFLPNNIYDFIKVLNFDLIYEIRLRTGFNIKINYNNKTYYLTKNGLSTFSDEKFGIICQKKDIDYIIEKVTEYSIYAFNDRIKEGYLTTKSGVRIGVAGECVFIDQKIQTIKNFTSLNIRVPHQIYGCSNELYKYLISGTNIKNLLICSPPFLGKTTLLKDLAIKLNNVNFGSILIIDERGEFQNIEGENIDKLIYVQKNYAFNFAIRAMSPSIIITDELNCESDWLCAKNAVNSGVKIIASCHCDTVEHLLNKSFFMRNIFDRYVFLNTNAFGDIKCVFDKEFKQI